MTDEIFVTNVRAGTLPTVILCDVLIGADVKIYDVTLRTGRGRTSYINLPKVWQRGRWVTVIEIVDADLLGALRRAVEDAAAEVLRYEFA